MMPSNHLTLCQPLSSCPQSFPALGSFPMSWLFASGGQLIGASVFIFLKLVYNTEGIWILTLCDLSSTEEEAIGPLPLNGVPNTLLINSWPICVFRPQFFTLSLDPRAKID